MRGDRSRWEVQYMQRVLATDPIGYWMQDEKQGIVSYDMVTARSDAARNGQYTGAALGQPGIGDGRTSPLSDGANDFTNIHSASLNTAFNGGEGSLLTWVRVSAAGVWTDGAFRYFISVEVDINNRVLIRKDNVNNRLTWLYQAGGVQETHSEVIVPPVVWFSAGITWSKAAETVTYYYNGLPVATDVNLGIWAGNLSNTATVVGAATTAPVDPWDGYEAHVPIWDRPLSPAEMLSLGVL